ncbi:MAG: hypothetical protein IT384_17005 [Deltaproteobacteria bacterium]|nr:hypothetical protein [Deltaproteobacteria bacterium]
MPVNASNLKDYGLFKQFWTTDEGTPDGLAHRGLDEVTPLGADRLSQYALDHDVNGVASPADQKVIDEDEREVMRLILEHPHYGSFFELDARPVVLQKFGLPAESVHMPSTANHPVDAGEVAIPSGVSKYSIAQLSRTAQGDLADLMMQEYKSKKAYFESSSLPAEERAARTIGLLAHYSAALWANGESEETESAGKALIDAFEALPYAKALGAKDFNGAGWSSAQSLLLGLDPNAFETKFPEAYPTAETTYLAMNGEMASPMGFVDEYRAAMGMDARAKAYEEASVLGWMLGEVSGHSKHGSLKEETPFESSGLNWGILMFPGDQEIKAAKPKPGFEFPIDCIDGFNNAVQARPGWGDRIDVVDAQGKKLKVEKKIETDADGSKVWSAEFFDSAGKKVEPANVLGLIKTKSGSVKGDGKASRSLDMWWWGFCDRNTAQRLYKSAYNIPQLDREQIKVKAGDKTITVPKEMAQKLVDCDIPDLVTGESFCGFRFNEEPQSVKLKNGEALEGRVTGLSLEAGPGVSRTGGDRITLHDAPGRPMLGTIEVKTEYSNETVDVRKIDRITQEEGGKVTIKLREGEYPAEMAGEAITKLPWAKAQTIDGKKVLVQGEEFPVRGGFSIELADGSTRRVEASEVSQISGETQKDLRLSQYMVWVSKMNGMYATDGSTGVVVSNGMRWVNKLDVREDAGDERPEWAPKGTLNGINGPAERLPGDKILWVKGLYAHDKESDPTSTNFSGWIQVSKNGTILNEGFVSGQPDFAWGANGPLNWLAKSSFNPHYPPEMRLALFVNGVSDLSKLEANAEKLGLPSNWKSYLVAQS